MSAVEASPLAGSPIFNPELMIRKIARIAKITGKVEGITKIYLENQTFFLSGIENARHTVFTLRSNLNTAIGRIDRISLAFEQRPDLRESYPYKYFQAFKKMIIPLIQYSALSRLEYIYIESVLNTKLESIVALPVQRDFSDEKVKRCWLTAVSCFSFIKDSFDSRQLQLNREILGLVMQKLEAFREGIRPHLADPLSSAPFDSKLPDFSISAIIEQSPMPDDYLREDLSLGLFPLLVNIGLVKCIISHMAEHESLLPTSLHSEDSVLIFALQQRKEMEVKLCILEQRMIEGADPFLAVSVSSLRDKFDEISSSEWVGYFTKEVLLHTLDKKAAFLHQRINEKNELKLLIRAPKADLDLAKKQVFYAWGEYSQALSDLRELFENQEEYPLMQDVFLRHDNLVKIDKDEIYIHVDRLQESLVKMIERKDDFIHSSPLRREIVSHEAQIAQLGHIYRVSYNRLMVELKDSLTDPYTEKVIACHEWLLERGV